MITIGKYSIPELVSFADALRIAKMAIEKYGGKMSNRDIAEAMDYKVKDDASISGYIFRKFDDMCSYNLMKRERGYLSVTTVAYEALDPIDTRKAEQGKAKALRQMPIVNDAFTKWNGEIPQETAILSKVTTDFGLPWQEAQKNLELLKKLFIEAFPYLKAVTGTQMAMTTQDTVTGRDSGMEKTGNISPIGLNNELRTEEYGILKIKDDVSIDVAIKILESLKQKLALAIKKEGSKSENS